MGFVETNVPWHRNDFLYDVSVANKAIWPTPTKTVAASCRSETKLTTKIQSTSSDYLGRSTKIRLFAKT